MSVKLSWRQINAPDSITIYRATSPIDAGALPAPLVTLSGAAVEYEDTTAVRGTLYYFRIAMTKGANTILSDNQLFGYYPNSGPGPQKLLRGDWKRGYFGRVPTADFLLAADAKTLCGLTAGTAVADTSLTHWYKYVFDGKILFIPNCAVATSVTWRNIYDAGLMYGTDDAGSAPANSATSVATATNQKKIVTAKGFNFLVRSPKASNQPTNVPYTVDTQLADTDWMETISRMWFTPTRADAKARWDDQSTPTLSAICQHFSATANVIMVIGADVPSTLASSSTSATYGWFPIFELQY